MRSEQNAVLASLRRAQQFLDTNADLLGAVNASTRKQLDDVVTQLSDLSVAQDVGDRGSRGETANQRTLVAALRRNYMAPVAELAKLKLRDVPGFASLNLPPANATPQRTVAAAYGMADAAAPYAETLIDNGLPATFADDIRKAAADVVASIEVRSGHLSQRTTATAKLGAEEKRGRSMLRVLNALITAHIGADAGLNTAWAGAKAVRQKPGPTIGSQTHDGPPVVSPVTPVIPPVTIVPPSAPTLVTTTSSTPTPVTPPAAAAA